MIKHNDEIQLSMLVDGEYKNLGDINKYEYNTIYKNNDNLISKHGFDCTLSIDTNIGLNNNEFNKMFGVDESKVPNPYNVEFLCCIPCRRHKNKRIDKKWTKKYGQNYIIVRRIGKGRKLNTYTDGTFEFVKDGEL